MPYRRLPKTDEARLKALSCLLKNDNVYTVKDRSVDWDTLSRARSVYEKLLSAHRNYKQCLKNQTNLPPKYDTLYRMARMYVSHFIQVLNMSMLRGEIREERKVFYGLQIGDFTLPDISTEQAVIAWGERMITGERERLKKGGVPIYNPTIAKVSVHYELFRTQYEQYRDNLEKTRKSLKILDALRPDADEVITQIWNQVEASYHTLPPETRFRKCMEYGVVYYYRKGEARNLF